MASVQVSRTIAATPERVFDAATDVHRWASVVPAIERVEVLTDGPTRVGTRFRETRRMFGREATEEMEFVALDRPRGYALRAESHGSRYLTTFTLTPEGGGTRLEMRFEATPLTFGAKVASVLMRPMMKKLGEMCARDLDAIKAHLEGTEAGGSSAR